MVYTGMQVACIVLQSTTPHHHAQNTSIHARNAPHHLFLIIALVGFATDACTHTMLGTLKRRCCNGSTIQQLLRMTGTGGWTRTLTTDSDLKSVLAEKVCVYM